MSPNAEPGYPIFIVSFLAPLLYLAPMLLIVLIALAGCTGCNHFWPDKDQICGPYSSVFWLPS